MGNRICEPKHKESFFFCDSVSPTRSCEGGGILCTLCVFVCTCLVTEADSQLVERYSVRTVGSEEHLELDGMVYVETGRAELGLALYCSETERVRLGMCNAAVFT